MATSTVDLQPFCDQDPDCLWPGMLQPFVQSGKRYATDARIAIEIDANGEPDTPLTGSKRNDPPNAKYVFDAIWKADAVFAAWPAEQPVMGKIDCPECENVECSTCDGMGEQTCDLGHKHECEDCDGEGVIRNRACICKGTGQIRGVARQQIEGKQIDVKYDRLVRTLPGPVEYAMNGEAVTFRFDGGRGIVMCFSDNIESEIE